MSEDEEREEKVDSNRDIGEEEDLEGELTFNLQTSTRDDEYRCGIDEEELAEQIIEKVQEESEDDSD